jgi:hypothetical protein
MQALWPKLHHLSCDLYASPRRLSRLGGLQVRGGVAHTINLDTFDQAASFAGDFAGQDTKRLLAFLLCYDTHKEFINFLKTAMSTLNELSGKYCDIFTIERYVLPKSSQTLHKSRYSLKEIAALLERTPRTVIGWIDSNKVPLEKRKNREGQYVFTNSDMMQLRRFAQHRELRWPNRTQCNKFKKSLFKSHKRIILPGLAVSSFVPIGAISEPKERVQYYPRGKMNHDQLDEEFQEIFESLRIAYEDEHTKNSKDVFHRFEKLEASRRRGEWKSVLTDVRSWVEFGIRLARFFP